MASDAEQSLARAEQNLQLQRDSGAITGFQFEEQLLAKRQEVLAVMLAQVQAAEALAPASSDPAVRASAEDLRLKYERLRQDTVSLEDQLLKTFVDELPNGFASAFGAVLQRLQAMIRKDLTNELYNGLQGALKGAGGWGSIASGIAGAFGYSGGGHTGPGSKYQSAGIVHADEFVLQKEAQRKFPRGFLGYMNTFGRLPPGYSDGGLVGAGAAMRLAAPAGGAASVTTNVDAHMYLNSDHAAEAALNSRTGQAKVIEIVLANKRKLGIS